MCAGWESRARLPISNKNTLWDLFTCTFEISRADVPGAAFSIRSETQCSPSRLTVMYRYGESKRCASPCFPRKEHFTLILSHQRHNYSISNPVQPCINHVEAFRHPTSCSISCEPRQSRTTALSPGCGRSDVRESSHTALASLFSCIDKAKPLLEHDWVV